MQNVRVILTYILACLCFQVILQAQYKPLVTANKEWLIKTCESGGCLYDYYFFSEDTVINSLTYKPLDGYHYNENFFIREDISSRQVFIMVQSGPFPQEYLVYDFGKSVGDSVYLENPVSPAMNYPGWYFVDSVVSRAFEQIPRRVFYLHAKDSQTPYQYTSWIEGVGSTALINTPVATGDTASLSSLLCVSENGSKIYSRYPNDTCYSNPTFGTDDVAIDDRVECYFDNTNKVIHWKEVLLPSKISVYKLTGQLAFAYDVEESEGEVSTDLNSGVYIMVVVQNEKILSQKILVSPK